MYDKYELEHATRYAHELTKVYLFEKYLKEFPYLFQHATLEKRPATLNDYYIPPTLAHKCIVVTRTRFDEMGCQKASCFGFTEQLEPCEPSDPARYIPIGKGFVLACQPMCQYEGAFETEFRNGKCLLSNDLKKIFALFPETVSGMHSKHNFHTGLDVRDGHLHLNEWYCRSYGLDFENGDCVSSIGQTIGEIFLGSNVYRGAFKTQKTNPAHIVTPPVPDYVHQFPKPRTKRSVDDDTPSAIALAIAQDMAIELSVDYGVDVSVDLIRNILEKRVPALITKATQIHVKQAMIQAVLHSRAPMMAIHASKLLGKGFSAASGVWTMYGLFTLLFDILDPYQYNRVLDKKTLEKVNRQFDLRFYKTESIREVEVTPQYFWDKVTIETDQSDRFQFMAERIDEYITALHQLPNKPNKNYFHKTKREERKSFITRWNFVFHAIIMFSVLCLSFALIHYLHVITLLAFFFYVYVYPEE